MLVERSIVHRGRLITDPLRETMAEQGLSPKREAMASRGRFSPGTTGIARDLPWRAPPGGSARSLSASGCRRSCCSRRRWRRSRTIIAKFIARWPTVEALAAAPLDDVLKAWAGLGYYARARNLHACAKAVADAAWRRISRHRGGRCATLPGIGPYTAGAIAAIAFDRRAAAVDGNVERVIARLYAIETPLPEAKPAIRERTLALVPDERAGDFAQALMDLGATICTPKRAQLPDLSVDG